MVTIIKPEPPSKTEWVSDRRLYLDKDGNVVEGKGPNRVSLLVAAGNTLPMETARKYGLVKDDQPEPAPVPPVVKPAAKVETQPEPLPAAVKPKAIEETEPVAEMPKPDAKPRKEAKLIKPAKK